MVNCEYGKIYKLYSKEQNITYIGSTAQYYLSRRLDNHKSTYKCYLNHKSNYVTSFKILECEDYKIELLEDYPCANKKQLKDRERWYIENNECVNKNIPSRTQAEWRQDNREYIKDYNKEYKEVNIDKIKARGNEYYTNNIDKIKARVNQVIVCQCGCEVIRGNLSRHKKNKKHIRLMELVQNN